MDKEAEKLKNEIGTFMANRLGECSDLFKEYLVWQKTEVERIRIKIGKVVAEHQKGATSGSSGEASTPVSLL